MKKYLSLFVVLVLAFTIGLSTTQAQINTSTDTKVRGDASAEAKLNAEGGRSGVIAELRQEFMAKREEARQKMLTLREQLKSEKDAMKAEIKEKRITSRERALERFDGAITRITNLKDRIVDHIARLELKGVNIEDAKEFVATAELKLEAADAKTAEMNALLAISIEELSQENKTKLRTLAQETQTLLKEAHNALKDAVKSLREAVKVKLEAQAGVNASATAETN